MASGPFPAGITPTRRNNLRRRHSNSTGNRPLCHWHDGERLLHSIRSMGLDSNTGQLPTSAVQTLAAGYALLTSGNNDVLVLDGQRCVNWLQHASRPLPGQKSLSSGSAYALLLAFPNAPALPIRRLPVLLSRRISSLFQALVACSSKSQLVRWRRRRSDRHCGFNLHDRDKAEKRLCKLTISRAWEIQPLQSVRPLGNILISAGRSGELLRSLQYRAGYGCPNLQLTQAWKSPVAGPRNLLLRAMHLSVLFKRWPSICHSRSHHCGH